MKAECPMPHPASVFFVGSRRAVLDEIRVLGLPLCAIAAPVESPLQQALAVAGTPHIALESKAHLLRELRRTQFDLLVSNGCPYILPVSELGREGRRFVNVHPSLLPNLRGRHPVNGALLFVQPAGATCHLMDDGIDTGPVIARVHIDGGEQMELGLLYRLAFMAEAEAFRKAYARDFEPGQDPLASLALGRHYFSRSDPAMTIDFGQPLDALVRRVAAFSVPGQLARFNACGATYRVARAGRVDSRYLDRAFHDLADGTLVLKYDDSLLVKLRDGFLLLSGVLGELSRLREGCNLKPPVIRHPSPSGRP